MQLRCILLFKYDTSFLTLTPPKQLYVFAYSSPWLLDSTHLSFIGFAYTLIL